MRIKPTASPRRGPWRVAAALLAAALSAAACSGGAGSGSEGASTVTVYSGRNQELIQPLLEAFSEATGHEVQARYGSSAEQALLIQTEGDASPADVFISQSPGALGLLAGEGRLANLAGDITERVPAQFAAGDGTWVGITGRIRVLVYNSELVTAAELPSSVFDLTGPAYAGRVAVAPGNGSFQDFVTAMRNERGDQATLDWLQGMAANDSPNYPKNSAIVEAVGRGEVDMGLVNHYYNLRALEADPSLPSVNHYFADDDLGSLVIVTGAALLGSSENPEAAMELIRYLLGADAQASFATQTQEYPLAHGTASPAGLPALAGYAADTIDYDLLGGGLSATIELIRESGIEQ